MDKKKQIASSLKLWNTLGRAEQESLIAIHQAQVSSRTEYRPPGITPPSAVMMMDSTGNTARRE
jgi:hypothetical protein